jgi:hypothetical protein
MKEVFIVVLTPAGRRTAEGYAGVQFVPPLLSASGSPGRPLSMEVTEERPGAEAGSSAHINWIAAYGATRSTMVGRDVGTVRRALDGRADGTGSCPRFKPLRLVVETRRIVLGELLDADRLLASLAAKWLSHPPTNPRSGGFRTRYAYIMDDSVSPEEGTQRCKLELKGD